MQIDNRVNGKTKVIALIGNPVEHTISPYIHNTISSLLGHNLIYVPLRTDKHSLEEATLGLRALNISGFNVTVPYKREIMKYMDDNSRDSLLMGAINTVKNTSGKLVGYNTDAEGFLRSFKEESGEGFEGKRVMIIGAGGAARAIAVKIAQEGAEKICVINRTISKATEISETINQNIGNIVSAAEYSDENFYNGFENNQIIINTTAVGMYPEIDETPLNENYFESHHIVYDVIYNPRTTKFLQQAIDKNAKPINGLGMLVYQAILAYEIWTGTKIGSKKSREIFDAISSMKI